jgi:hypothetical protein
MEMRSRKAAAIAMIVDIALWCHSVAFALSARIITRLLGPDWWSLP